MVNLAEYRFRASSIGKIMKGAKPNLTDKQKETLEGLIEKRNSGKITDKQTSTLGSLIEKRDAKPKLSTGAISYLDEIIQEVIFGRSKEITSKYLSKGIAVEEYSFSLYTEVSNQFLVKNDERFNNEWITGEPDNVQEMIRDIKSSWDFSTFPLHATDIPNDIYKWQLLAYMELTELKKAELVYCLVDTPFTLIDDEIRRLSWKMGYLSLDSMPTEVKVETVCNHIYTLDGLEAYCHQSSDLKTTDFDGIFKPVIKEHRIKVFEMYYDYKMVEQMYTYLQLARNYLITSATNLADKIAA